MPFGGLLHLLVTPVISSLFRWGPQNIALQAANGPPRVLHPWIKGVVISNLHISESQYMLNQIKVVCPLSMSDSQYMHYSRMLSGAQAMFANHEIGRNYHLICYGKQTELNIVSI